MSQSNTCSINEPTVMGPFGPDIFILWYVQFGTVMNLA
jgi:hypothetical protein